MYEIYRQCAGIYDFGVTYEHAADFERQQSCFSVHACLGPTTTLNAKSLRKASMSECNLCSIRTGDNWREAFKCYVRQTLYVYYRQWALLYYQRGVGSACV